MDNQWIACECYNCGSTVLVVNTKQDSYGRICLECIKEYIRQAVDKLLGRDN